MVRLLVGVSLALFVLFSTSTFAADGTSRATSTSSSVANSEADQAKPPGDTKEKEKPVDMSLEELLHTFVTSASKLSQLVSDAPAPIEVIPDYMIDGFGWNSINSVLYGQPGFAVSQDYDRQTVSSRGVFEGWNNNHLLMMVDGIPVNDNLYGTAYTSEITPLFFTKNLEILRGPGSALYGSNAMNGAISMKTYSARDLPGVVTGSIRVGNDGIRYYDVLGGTATDLGDFVLGYSTNRTNGNEYLSLDGSRRTDANGNLEAFRTHDHRWNDYLFAKFEPHHAFEGLTLELHHQAWEFGTGHGWIFYIPDFEEAMREARTIASGTYHHANSRGWNVEYAARYQEHEINWNQRYYPNNATDPYGDFYPAGLWEYLHTSAADYFTRAQVTIPTVSGSNFVGGFEGSYFLYNGDREHYSNVDINNGGTFQQVPGGAFERLRPWLEWVAGNPVLNLAAYGQFSSGSLLGSKLTATVGGRFDRQSFDLNAIDVEGAPKESHSFHQLSPRLSVVYKASDALTLKALAGRAFRAPAPTELFGANTYSLASNPRQLRPETLTNYELAAEWRPGADLLLRANVFRNSFNNEITYSVANANLSTNVYSLKTAGTELEALIGTPNDSGFVNASWVKRLDERIIDPTIAVSPHDMTWYPSLVANAGYLRNSGKLQESVTVHYQGRVNRRASDLADMQFDLYRPNSVAAWTSLDGSVDYRLSTRFDIGIKATNVLNQKDRMLIKTNAFPFDYRMADRRVMVVSRLTFAQ